MPTETLQPEDAKRFQCRHVFTDGHRCGSPALRKEHFCYFHHTTRPRASSPRRLAVYDVGFELPLAEDRASIQLAIAQILIRIADGSLEPKRARLLLYGLRTASQNLPRQQQLPAPTSNRIVENLIPDPEHGTLAPVVELQANPDDDPDGQNANQKPTRDIAAELARKWRLKMAQEEYVQELDAQEDREMDAARQEVRRQTLNSPPIAGFTPPPNHLEVQT